MDVRRDGPLTNLDLKLLRSDADMIAMWLQKTEQELDRLPEGLILI